VISWFPIFAFTCNLYRYVAVIKNHPAYFHQAHVEIGILHMLNTKCDERDEHHIVVGRCTLTPPDP
jgi:hypothetical protein